MQAIRDGIAFVVTERAAALLGPRWGVLPRYAPDSGAAAARRPLAVIAAPEDAPLLEDIRVGLDVTLLVVSSPARERGDANAPPREAHAGPELALDAAGLHVGATQIPLSPVEHRLLGLLLAYPGLPRSRGELRAVLPGGGTGRALDAHIYRLRRKLAAVSSLRIETLRQRGFRLRADGLQAVVG